MADRERRVSIGGGPVLGWHEFVSWHFGHCGAHTWTEPSHTAGARGRSEHCVDLIDHPLAIGGVLLRRRNRNQHGTCQDGASQFAHRGAAPASPSKADVLSPTAGPRFNYGAILCASKSRQNNIFAILDWSSR